MFIDSDLVVGKQQPKMLLLRLQCEMRNADKWTVAVSRQFRTPLGNETCRLKPTKRDPIMWRMLSIPCCRTNSSDTLIGVTIAGPWLRA